MGKRLLGGLALATGSVLFAVLLFELGLRIAGKSYFGSFYTPDRDLGWALRPSTEAWVSEEAHMLVKVNSHGQRDREHDVAKPPNTLRIAILGDSYTEAMHLGAEQAYWAVVEKELGRCRALGGRQPEVINFGVSGYGTAQALQMLRTRVWRFNPDAVVLGFYLGNDVFDNHPALNPNPSREQSPFFRLAGNGVVLDESFRRSSYLTARSKFFQDLRGGAVNNSRVLQLIYKVLDDTRKRRARAALDRRAGVTGADSLEEKLFVPPATLHLEEAWALTEAMIAAMNREVRQHGAQFWTVVIGARPQVHPDPAWRAALAMRLGAADLSYPNQRLQVLADRERMRLVLLAPDMVKYAEDRKFFLHGTKLEPPGTGHWNETGHEVAGRLIAARMCADLGAPQLAAK